MLRAVQGDITGEGGVIKRIIAFGDESRHQAQSKDLVELTLSGYANDKQRTVICQDVSTSAPLVARTLRICTYTF